MLFARRKQNADNGVLDSVWYRRLDVCLNLYKYVHLHTKYRYCITAIAGFLMRLSLFDCALNVEHLLSATRRICVTAIDRRQGRARASTPGAIKITENTPRSRGRDRSHFCLVRTKTARTISYTWSIVYARDLCKRICAKGICRPSKRFVNKNPYRNFTALIWLHKQPKTKIYK